LYCNGEEYCSEDLDSCAHRDAPSCPDNGLWCDGEEYCEETSDTCEHRNSPVCADDAKWCNGDEYCDDENDVCGHRDAPSCPDDGLYCTGEEYCNEDEDACDVLNVPECADDGLFCNGEEYCSEDLDTCDHRNPPSCPDDGLFCTGEEYCVESLDACGNRNVPDCADDGEYCNGEEFCNEDEDACDAANIPECPDDNLYCTGEEFCNEALNRCDVRNVPDCSDDGLYCNGEEYCNEDEDICDAANIPSCPDDNAWCTGEEYCNEELDACDVHNIPDCTDNGLYCDGEEYCNEDLDQCDHRAVPECPDDNLYCTGEEYCNEQLNACDARNVPDCPDDGLYCTGEEYCNEELDQCDHQNAPDCPDDGLYCTGEEYCDEDQDQCGHQNVPACPDDGQFCTGDEFCDEDNDVCANSGDPCGISELCNEQEDICETTTPIVTIIEPEDDAVFDIYLIDILAEIQYLDDEAGITVYLDGVDITTVLAVSNTAVVGQINAESGGQHTLRVEAENEDGIGFDEVSFLIDKPWIKVYSPLPGSVQFARTVEIDADYGNCPDCEVTVVLDDVDITGELDIWGGGISGDVTGLEEIEHELVFRAEEGNKGDFVEVTVPFFVELEEPHFELFLSATTIFAAEYVDLIYVFYNENGEDITSLIDVDILVDPADGVVIAGNRLWFHYPGLFEIQVGTAYPGYGYITGTSWVFVQPTEPWNLDLELSAYEIDAGEWIIADATVTDENGNEMSWIDVVFQVDPPFGVSIDDNAITLTKAGISTVTALIPGTGVYDSKEVQVNPGLPIELELYCDRPIVGTYDPTDPDPDTIVTCGVEIKDFYGNAVEGEPYTYLVVPPGGVTNLGDEFTFEYDGYFVISATSVHYPLLVDTFMVQAVNSDPPGVVITAPDRALYTQNDTVNLTGYVYNVDLLDPDTVVYLHQGASQQAMYFDWQTGDFGPELIQLVNGLNMLSVEVVINEGSGPPDEIHAKAATSVLYALYEWPNNSMIENILGVRIDDLGFDQIETIAESYLDAMPIEEMMMAMNPLFAERVELWGVPLASAKAVLTGVSWDIPQLMLDATPDALITQALLPYMKLDFKVTGNILFVSYRITGYVEVENVFLDTFSWLYLDPSSHQIILDMDQADFNVGSLHLHIDGFPDELANWFEHVVEGAIEDTANASLRNEIPDLIQDLLNDIPLRFEFPVGDATFSFDGQPETLTTTATGMTIWMDGRVISDTINPAVRPLNGSIRTPSSVPDLAVIPNGSQAGVAVALSDDMFNQIFYTVYRSGMIHLNVDDAFDACDTLLYTIIPEICDTFQILPGLPLMLDISIAPSLPPVMLLTPITGKSGTLETQIQIGDMMIHLLADDATAPGGHRPVLSLSVSATIPANIEHVFETNTLTVNFGTPIVFVDTVSNPAMLTESFFEDLAPLLVELIMPILAEAIEGFTLPTFDVGNDTYRTQVNDIFYIGASGAFMGIFGALEDTVVPPK